MKDRGGRGPSRGGRLSRRAALTLPFALAGCGLFDERKPKIPGKREPVMAERRGLQVDDAGATPRVALPPPTLNAAWPQAGGNPAHVMGHLAAGERLTEVWRADIGSSAGYRSKILAQPVVAGGTVYTMDPDGVVTAFDLATGRRHWRADTKDENDDSTNVGGGLAVDGGTLYAANGLAELVAYDVSKGAVRWRRNIGAPARSSPTVSEGRLFVVTLDGKLAALAPDDGRPLWTHQAASTTASMLGQPAPAFSDGLVVAGFGSGELAALRAETGDVVWTDSLAGSSGRSSFSDISAIRGLPAIADGAVYAVGLGGLLVAIDLRSGRRLWEREVSGEDSPWVAGDWLFVISADQQIAALQRRDGRVAWVSDLPRYDDEEKQTDPILWFGPILVGDRLIAVSTNEQALAISPYSGKILGRQMLSGAASLGPTVADRTVLIVTDEGKLLALR